MGQEPGNPMEVEGTLNPAAARAPDGKLYLFPRIVAKGNVITELSEIYRAAKEGRGDLLIVSDDFHQAVRVTDEFSLDLVTDVTLPGVIDDITSEIAWDVISKKGRAIFTTGDELKSLGEIALKVRY